MRLVSRKRKAAPVDPALALWPCGTGLHAACTGGPVLVQHAMVTAGRVKAGSQNQKKRYPLVLDYVCPCECHRGGEK